MMHKHQFTVRYGVKTEKFTTWRTITAKIQAFFMRCLVYWQSTALRRSLFFWVAYPENGFSKILQIVGNYQYTRRHIPENLNVCRWG